MKNPYYAVIFTSIQCKNTNGYTEMAELMETLAKQQPGFLGIECARNEIGITISYWQNLESIKNWKANIDHLVAQKKGKEQWYAYYKVRICKVEREYEFLKNSIKM
ncbi:antibiotic biosynthesis monooxygenase [Aequorivita viscosa]|nr:antibiotic biosynthesis monooxygenase [Aequorivita viscosa]